MSSPNFSNLPPPNTQEEAQCDFIRTIPIQNTQISTFPATNPATPTAEAGCRDFPLLQRVFPSAAPNFEGIASFEVYLMTEDASMQETTPAKLIEVMNSFISDIVANTVPADQFSGVAPTIFTECASCIIARQHRAAESFPAEMREAMSRLGGTYRRQLSTSFRELAAEILATSQLVEKLRNGVNTTMGTISPQVPAGTAPTLKVPEEIKTLYANAGAKGEIASNVLLAKVLVARNKNLGLQPALARRLLASPPYNMEHLLDSFEGDDSDEKLARDIVAQEWHRERIRTLQSALTFLRSRVDVAAHGTPEDAMKWVAERLRFLGIEADSVGGQLLCLAMLDVDENVVAAFTSFTTSGTLRAPGVPTTPVKQWDANTALGMPQTLAETVRAVIDTASQIPNIRLMEHGPARNVWPCFTPHQQPGIPAQVSPYDAGGEKALAAATSALSMVQTSAAAPQPFRAAALSSQGAHAQTAVNAPSALGAQGMAGTQPKATPPSICPKCKSGLHWAKECPTHGDRAHRNEGSTGGRK